MLARTTLLEELGQLRRRLTQSALQDTVPGAGADALIEAWRATRQEVLACYNRVIADQMVTGSPDLAMLSVGPRASAEADAWCNPLSGTRQCPTDVHWQRIVWKRRPHNGGIYHVGLEEQAVRRAAAPKEVKLLVLAYMPAQHRVDHARRHLSHADGHITHSARSGSSQAMVMTARTAMAAP